MPYFRCPACGFLAHVADGDHTAIDCTRCSAADKRVPLEPVEESLRLTGQPRRRPDREPAD